MAVLGSVRLAVRARARPRSFLCFPVIGNAIESVSLEMLKLVLVSLSPLCIAKEDGSGFIFSFLFCHALDRIPARPKQLKLSPCYPHFIMHLNSLEVHNIVLRVCPIRVFSPLYKSTTYSNWHDSFMLI